jgi:hypothetical protein
VKAQPTYEIRIAGQLDGTTLGSLAGPDVSCHDGITIITGQFDQAALHGKLEMIRSLRLDLLEARRIRGFRGTRPGEMTRSPLTDDPGAANIRQHGLIATGSRKEASVTRHTYEIKVIGSLGPATREAFTDMAVETEPTITVLSGDLDQCGLHAVLDRMRALGLELVEIKQAPPRPG